MYKQINFAALPKNIWTVLCAVCMIITNLLGLGGVSASSEVELVKTDKIVLDEALFAGQGITTDGEFYYTSGSITATKTNGLAKWTVDDFELVNRKAQVIPQEYVDAHDSDHVGGISYYNGLIYAGVENKPEDYPLVITYDCENFDVVDVYEMPLEMLPDGIPWVAVDADNGFLYTSPFRDVEAILAFDLETMEFDHTIPLSKEITRIQGGEVSDGVLYLSYDKTKGDEEVLAVDVFTGEVSTFCTRAVEGLGGNEAEDLTVFEMEDGSFIHALDYDKAVGVRIEHYALADAK